MLSVLKCHKAFGNDILMVKDTIAYVYLIVFTCHRKFLLCINDSVHVQLCFRTGSRPARPQPEPEGSCYHKAVLSDLVKCTS